MMRKEEQVRKAMLHYLEGSIHPEELEMLNRVVESDADARRDLAELMLQDALLTKVSQETEFFELDTPAAVPPAALSCSTSRIMKITRRAPVVPEARAPKPAPRRGLIAAAAILFLVTVGAAVSLLRSGDPEPLRTTVMPIAPVAPAAAAPLQEEPAPVEPPARAVADETPAPKAAPSKPKPAAKPKTSTAKKDVPEPIKPGTNVPEGYLSLPSSNKLPPPAPSKPAPKLPPKQPAQK